MYEIISLNLFDFMGQIQRYNRYLKVCLLVVVKLIALTILAVQVYNVSVSCALGILHNTKVTL